MASRDDEIYTAIARLALAGDGIVLGMGAAILAIRTWVRLYSLSKAHKKLADTPLTQIADLRFLVNQQSEDNGQNRAHMQSSKTDARSEQQNGESLVIVRGKVQSKAALEGRRDEVMAPIRGEEAVIMERIQTCLYNEWRGLFGWSSDWRGLLGWGTLKEQATVSRRKVPFVLMQYSGIHDHAFVHINMDESKHPLPLVTVHRQLHPVQASPYTFVQALFGRGYPVGLLDEEKILPIGKDLTAVGILLVSSDGQPVIKSSKKLPYFLTENTRDQLIAELATSTKVLFWTGIVATSVAVGVLGYAFIRGWWKWQNWRQHRQRQDELARQNRIRAEETDDDIGDVPDGELCVVCLMRQRRAAFVPCGHHVCCVGCARRVEEDSNAKCPVCRQSVDTSVRIYDT